MVESKLTFHGGAVEAQAEAMQEMEQLIENAEQGISFAGGGEASGFSA
ncbi:hypothetical protein BH23GEM6_BH23GEM6_25500 [soil metagenome]